MSDSVRPQRRQPTRLPVPGILQARTLEWVAISFSDAWKWKVKVKVKSLSRVRLLATQWTAAHQAPRSLGFSRQEYWSGVPLPSLTYALKRFFWMHCKACRILVPWPGLKAESPAVDAQNLNHWTTREVPKHFLIAKQTIKEKVLFSFVFLFLTWISFKILFSNLNISKNTIKYRNKIHFPLEEEAILQMRFYLDLYNFGDPVYRLLWVLTHPQSPGLEGVALEMPSLWSVHKS